MISIATSSGLNKYKYTQNLKHINQANHNHNHKSQVYVLLANFAEYASLSMDNRFFQNLGDSESLHKNTFTELDKIPKCKI